MADRWVTNSSPLILFGKIGQLDLLIQMAGELVVPDAVLREITVRSNEASLADLLKSAKK